MVYRPEKIKDVCTGRNIPFGVFLDEFGSMVDNYQLHPSDVLFTGDFNIWLDVPDDPETKQFMNLLSCYGLKQHVTEATHIHGHILDLLITRENESVLSEVCVKPGLSDHFDVSCNLEMQRPPLQWKTFTTRNLKAIDFNIFRQDITKTLSEIDFKDESVDVCVQKYESLLSALLDKHAPAKTRRVLVRPNTPWFNAEIKEAKCYRRELEHKWRRSKLEVDRQCYCKQRQVVKGMIEEAKAGYYSASVAQCTGDQKSLFRVVDNLLHKSKEPVLPTSTSDQTLANRFCEYFVGKIDQIRSEFDSHCQVTEDNVSECVTHLTDFEPTTNEEVLKTLMKAPTKSCELDPLPTWVVKEFVHEIVPSITSIINKSFVTGNFPNDLKIAYIRPLLKKPSLDKEDLKNFRPVANLKFLGKMIERIASSRIMSVIDEHDLLDPFQSAYRANHSLETALLRVNNDILRAMDSGKVTALVLLDLSAAFDTVDHNILLTRLRTDIGVSGAALRWCESYLRNRSTCVRVGNSSSETVALNYSVPQGSVLGPQWFVIYTSQIRHIIQRYNLHHHVYADDTQIYLSFDASEKSVNDSIHSLEACIVEIRHWMRNNYLKLNDSKTEFILIGSRHKLDKIKDIHIKIGDSIIAPVRQVRNLGVIMDDSMTLTSHVSSTVKSASFQIRNLGRIRKFLTPQATEQLVHAYVTSRLDMGNSLLFNLPKEQIHRLQLKQNMAARLITRTKPSAHITPILFDLHWLPVQLRIEFKILLLTYRAVNGLAPSYITELVVPYTSTRTGLRSADKHLLTEPKTSRSWGNRAFSASAPRLWNSLPIEIRSCSSLCSFKSMLKTHLMHTAYGHN